VLLKILASYGVTYATIEVDRHKSRRELTASLKKTYGQNTFPMLVVDGKLIGGCSDFKRMEHARELHFLAPYMTVFNGSSPSNEGPKRVRSISPLFWFPDTANNNAARVAGFIATLYCAVCIGMYNRYVTRWAVLALGIDFATRFFFGASASVIGAISTLVVSGLEPDYRAGAPKQFAAFCGTFFSVFSAGLWLGHYELGGVIVLGGLMGAAFLEAFFDFCAGCWMFGLAVQFGLVSPLLFRPSINLKEDKLWAFRYTYRDTNVYDKVTNEHVMLPGQKEPTEIDLIRKNRFEAEYKNKV
jgi:glutaredoxin